MWLSSSDFVPHSPSLAVHTQPCTSTYHELSVPLDIAQNSQLFATLLLTMKVKFVCTITNSKAVILCPHTTKYHFWRHGSAFFLFCYFPFFLLDTQRLSPPSETHTQHFSMPFKENSQAAELPIQTVPSSIANKADAKQGTLHTTAQNNTGHFFLLLCGHAHTPTKEFLKKYKIK